MQTNEPTSSPNQQISTPQPADTHIPQQQPSDVSLPVQESAQGKESNKWLIVGLGIFALIALGIAGIFAYQNYQLKKQVERPSSGLEVIPTKALQPTPTSTVSVPSPTPAVDPTASWTTYLNSKFGYSFKYPSTWEPNRGPGNLSDEELSNQRDIDFYDPSLPGEDPGTGFIVMVNELNAMGTNKECGDLEDCFTKTFSWLEEEITIDKQTTSFLGEPAITFTYQRKTALYSQSWKYLYFLFRNNAYNVHISTESGREKAIFNLFDQILSTFQFVIVN